MLFKLGNQTMLIDIASKTDRDEILYYLNNVKYSIENGKASENHCISIAICHLRKALDCEVTLKNNQIYVVKGDNSNERW